MLMGTIDQEGLRRLQSNWKKIYKYRANSSSCASNLTATQPADKRSNSAGLQARNADQIR